MLWEAGVQQNGYFKQDCSRRNGILLVGNGCAVLLRVVVMELWVVEVMIDMKRFASGLGSVYGILDGCQFGVESNIIIPCHFIKYLLKPATSPQHFSESLSLPSLNTPFPRRILNTLSIPLHYLSDRSSSAVPPMIDDGPLVSNEGCWSAMIARSGRSWIPLAML
jgi:hypothetical protein